MSSSFPPIPEEIFDAEERYSLSDEDDFDFEYGGDIECHGDNFNGLNRMNTTRWNSVAKMGRSHLKFQGGFLPTIKLSNLLSVY